MGRVGVLRWLVVLGLLTGCAQKDAASPSTSPAGAPEASIPSTAAMGGEPGGEDAPPADEACPIVEAEVAAAFGQAMPKGEGCAFGNGDFRVGAALIVNTFPTPTIPEQTLEEYRASQERTTVPLGGVLKNHPEWGDGAFSVTNQNAAYAPVTVALPGYSLLLTFPPGRYAIPADSDRVADAIVAALRG